MKSPLVVGRREAASALLLATALLLAGACSKPAPFVKETFVMGTHASVTIYGVSSAEAETTAAAALGELHRIENVMSNWRAESEISRLNRGSAGRPYRVSSELFGLIDSSVSWSRATRGAFDVTVRPLVTLWGFEGGTPRMPTATEIADAKKLVGYERIVLDADSSAVTLPPGMEIDLAGVAKGYAVDRAAAMLRSRGVRSGLVNLGGNMFAIGVPPGRRGWSIGIRDPRGATSVVGEILIADAAVATSGNYENFVELGGKRYGHLIDPATGFPTDAVLSVTVVAPTALATDALSTGLFVLGPQRGAEVARALPGVAALFAVEEAGRIGYRSLGDFGARLRIFDAAGSSLPIAADTAAGVR